MIYVKIEKEEAKKMTDYILFNKGNVINIVIGDDIYPIIVHEEDMDRATQIISTLTSEDFKKYSDRSKIPHHYHDYAVKVLNMNNIQAIYLDSWTSINIE